MGSRSRRPSPQFPIAPVLEYLGFEPLPKIFRGGYAKARCIFHDDQKPSAHVSEYGYICFACGKKGDAIKLLREEEGLSFEAAVTKCKELTGWSDRDSAPERQWGESLLG